VGHPAVEKSSDTKGDALKLGNLRTHKGAQKGEVPWKSSRERRAAAGKESQAGERIRFRGGLGRPQGPSSGKKIRGKTRPAYNTVLKGGFYWSNGRGLTSNSVVKKNETVYTLRMVIGLQKAVMPPVAVVLSKSAGLLGEERAFFQSRKKR